MGKKITLLLYVFIPWFLYSELVSVPEFNYSINPLEGWNIQPYSDGSELSWLSSDNNIALYASAWRGDKFSTLRDMFQSLTKDYDAYGSIVPFDYLGNESGIGEIELNINSIPHKGWALFINGDDFDYYLISFTLSQNYEEFTSEIQSVVDSFSFGELGALSPGPISSFVDNSPSREFKKYNIDFFGHSLTVSASEYDFGTTQALIEREAIIMENYSHDPKNFYNAWVRYYQIIFRDNYSRLDPLFNSLYPYFADNKYSDYEIVEILMFWIQGYKYDRTLESRSDLINPLEASLTKMGDCDSRSLVLGILLHKFGIENILFTSEKVKHALIGVSCEGEGYSFDIEGKKYLAVELTKKSLIGEIDESFKDLKLWTPVKMEYTNGF
ncbi:hypothetical protein EW093_09055 [Thiospirochaeta perfilievii]|uniref:Transglutaminase domain-containing protein n=1 Tax=Thiospirochaeta perfilievii TaxID=252967 RepID=A0A5C1Q9W8_9SPIO|nr:hypothetical protein [Thiospirochaeta perfilievii]QEN04845.1 hypothetical protein EW093_09055 [Thiospirochaeta perfilievii]